MNGSRLKKEINKLGLTSAEFSRISGLSSTTLCKIYKDEHVRERTVNKAWVTLSTIKENLREDTKRRTREALSASG